MASTAWAQVAQSAEEVAKAAGNATSPTPFGLADPGPGLTELMQVAGGLLLLLGVIFLGFWLLRKYGHKAGLGASAKGRLRLEGALSLGHRRNLVVVRFLNKVMLLGVTDHAITLLTHMDADDESSPVKESDGSGFLGALVRASESRQKPGTASAADRESDAERSDVSDVAPDDLPPPKRG